MTDKPTKTLPADVRARALAAIAKIHDWSAAVHQARAAEIRDGCPGKYEHALIDDPRWGQNNLGEDALNKLEQAYRAQGWSPDQLYQAIGWPRPATVRQSDRVMDWRGMGPR